MGTVRKEIEFQEYLIKSSTRLLYPMQSESVKGLLSNFGFVSNIPHTP